MAPLWQPASLSAQLDLNIKEKINKKRYQIKLFKLEIKSIENMSYKTKVHKQPFVCFPTVRATSLFYVLSWHLFLNSLII